MKTKTAENKKIEQPDIINGLIQNGETINSILSIGWMGKKGRFATENKVNTLADVLLVTRYLYTVIGEILKTPNSRDTKKIVLVLSKTIALLKSVYSTSPDVKIFLACQDIEDTLLCFGHLTISDEPIVVDLPVMTKNRIFSIVIDIRTLLSEVLLSNEERDIKTIELCLSFVLEQVDNFYAENKEPLLFHELEC